MKPAIRNTKATKASRQNTKSEIKSNQANETEQTQLSDAEQIKVYDRFIEASCDCV